MAGNGNGTGQGREAALLALARYRRGIALDGVGTADGTGGVECLLQRAVSADDLPGHHRRRVELVDRAVEEGWAERPLADEVYDVATEEGLDPRFAFELVRCGVAVCGPPDTDVLDAPAHQLGRPEWLGGEVPSDEAVTERRLRSSFRRLRRLLEEHDRAEDALVAFVGEPDVDDCGYGAGS